MDFFLSDVNRKIGEQMRWLRSYQANPQEVMPRTRTPAPSAPAGGLGTMLEPLLLMMLFQILLPAMTGQNPGTQNPPGSDQPLQPEFGAGTGMGGAGLMQGGIRQQTGDPEQNPARNYLEAVLGENEDLQSGAFLDALLTHLENRSFSEQHLGEALMYLLHQGGSEHSADIARLTGTLIHEGVINPKPFMQPGYLEKLDDARKAHLADALGQAGPLLADGSANRRLSGTVVEYAGTDSETGRFTEALLYRWVTRYPADAPDTTGAEAAAVHRMLGLTGLNPDELDTVYVT